MSEYRYCGPCETEGEHEETVVKFCVDCDQHLCADCWKYHTKIKTLRTHKCVDLDEDTGNLEVEKNEGMTEGKLNIDPIFCLQHPEKLKECYCTDCSELGCGDCMSERHTDCPLVDFPDVSRFIPTDRVLDDDHEFTELLDGLALTKESLRRVDTGMDTLRPRAEELKSTIEREAYYLQVDINEFMTMSLGMLGNVSDGIIDAEKDHYDRVGVAVKEIDRFRQTLEHIKDMMDVRVFHVITGVNQLLQDLTDIPSTQKNKKSLDLMEQIHKFIQGVHSFKTDMVHTPLGNAKVISMNVNSDNDPKECQISGGIVTGNKAIVADSNNKKVKLFDTENKKLIAELYLPILFRGD